MKLVLACLSGREDRGNSFHHCGSTVRLVQACLVQESPDNAGFNSEEVL